MTLNTCLSVTCDVYILCSASSPLLILSMSCLWCRVCVSVYQLKVLVVSVPLVLLSGVVLYTTSSLLLLLLLLVVLLILSMSCLWCVCVSVYQLKVVVVSVPLVLLSGVVLFIVVVYCWLKNRKYVRMLLRTITITIIHPSPVTCCDWLIDWLTDWLHTVRRLHRTHNMAFNSKTSRHGSCWDVDELRQLITQTPQLNNAKLSVDQWCRRLTASCLKTPWISVIVTCYVLILLFFWS